MRFVRVSPRAYGFDRPDFYVLETEVTNEMYARYLAQIGAAKGDAEVVAAVDARREEIRRTGVIRGSTGDPAYGVENRALVWTDNRPPAGAEQFPVSMVNPRQASAFCGWLTERRGELGTFRLPTKTEWLIAAYGRERSFPWGEVADERRYLRSPYHNDEERWQARSEYDRAAIKALEAAATRPASTSRPPLPPEPPPERPGGPEPVTSRPAGRTPEGLYGMWGNVSELVIPDERTGNAFVWGLGAKWMGGGYDDMRYEPRKDYWGYTHNSDVREQSIGFRVLLDPTDVAHRYRQELGPDAKPGGSIYGHPDEWPRPSRWPTLR